VGLSVSTDHQRFRIAMIVADEREEHRRYDLPEPYFGPAPSALLSGFAQLEHVETHVVSCVRQRTASPSQIAPNIFFHAVQIPRWGYLKTLYLPAISGLRKTLRKISPELVHGQGTERYYALAAAFSGYPSAVTLHGHMRAIARSLKAPPFSFLWLTAQLESVAIRRAGGVVCLSNYIRGAVERLAARTWVLHNAVPDEFFQVRRKRADLTRLLCVGLVCSYKNQNALICALDSVAASHPIELVFAGAIAPGEYGREFRELVAARPWVNYVGVLNGQRLRDELGLATCLVHPSLEDNCPMAILEAMAVGVPIIGSTCGGIPDLIEHGVTGFLCDPAAMSSFASAVSPLIRDPQLAEDMGIAGKHRAEREFRPRHVAEQHLKIFREILHHRGLSGCGA
jgi:glycosyltransferase involved in cell wall biosynthesis